MICAVTDITVACGVVATGIFRVFVRILRRIVEGTSLTVSSQLVVVSGKGGGGGEGGSSLSGAAVVAVVVVAAVCGGTS